MKYGKELLIALLILGTGFATDAMANGNIVGTVKARIARFQKNTVVYVQGIEGQFSPPADPVTLDQKNLAFHPKILPVLSGTTVDFLNSDEVLHNVFTPDKCADKFNLGSWPQGEVRSYTFDKPGCIAVILCNVHPEMEAYILVLQNPYYAISDEQGRLTIKDIPAGTYTVKVWNKRLIADPQKVTVVDGQDVEITIPLTR